MKTKTKAVEFEEGTKEYEDHYDDFHGFNIIGAEANNSKTGPWIHIKHPDKTKAAELEASICFTDIDSKVLDLAIASTKDGFEPISIWNRTTSQYDFSHIVPMLGLTDPPLEPESIRRRVLRILPELGSPNRDAINQELLAYRALSPDAGPLALTRITNTSRPIQYSTPDFVSNLLSQNFNMVTGAETGLDDQVYMTEDPRFPALGPRNIQMHSGSMYYSDLIRGNCLRICKDNPTKITNRSYVRLYKHLLDTTNNPALALKGFMLSLKMMAYNEYMHQFDYMRNVTISNSIEVQAPVRMQAIIATTVNSTVHLFLVILVLVLFLKNTRTTLLGNAWLAVSQVVSKDTQDIIERSTGMTDAETTAAINNKEGEVEDLARLKIVTSIGLAGGYRNQALIVEETKRRKWTWKK